jgi:phage terminase large subunit GpA-like protein
MLAGGHWVARNPGSEIRGYYLNGLYAPIGLGDTWLELAREYLRCKGDPVQAKRFANTKLGRVWKDAAKEIKPNQLMERAEDFRLRSIPSGCLILVAGVDTQDDRLAVQILGWGRREACWILDWIELPGDPAYPEVWERLTELLHKPLVNTAGRELVIRAIAIDSGGHRTQDVYNFVRETKLPRVMACKSHNTPNKPILASRPRPQEFNWRGRTIRNGMDLWMIGADTAKHRLYTRLGDDAQQEWRIALRASALRGLHPADSLYVQ